MYHRYVEVSLKKFVQYSTMTEHCYDYGFPVGKVDIIAAVLLQLNISFNLNYIG